MGLQGNLYGVDLKLTNTKWGVLPALIEINGVGYGTDFFRYSQGDAYYQAFARALSGTAAGKPIFIPSHNKYQPNVLDHLADIEETKDYVRERKRYVEKLREKVGPSFDFYCGWLDDIVTREQERMPEVDPEDEFYVRAAEQLGVEMHIYDDFEVAGRYVRFHLPTGDVKTIHVKDIGLIRPVQAMYDEPVLAPVIIGSELGEYVMDQKAVLTYMIEAAHVHECLPATAVYGFGVSDREKMKSFINSMPDDIVVSKQSGGSGGVGVQMITRAQALRQIEPRTTIVRSPERSIQAIKEAARETHIERYITVYQEFVESIPITHWVTGNTHDACARTAVYVPPGGEPTVLGSQWRLAPQPLDSDGPLESRLRANLCRGATPQPLAPEHEAIVNEAAVRIVKGFDYAVTNGEIQFRTAAAEFGGIVRPSRIMRMIFWEFHMREAERRHGLRDPDDMSLEKDIAEATLPIPMVQTGIK